jgi:hypothetical protein
MKKLLFKLVFLLPIPIILASVNYYFDPAHIFNSRKYLERAINYSHNGSNIANLINYDDRLFQKMWLEQLESPKDVIVIGSSRSMQINSSFFLNKDFYNNSVSGLDIYDLLAIYNLYDKKNLLPKKIVIGLDPWMLNSNYKDSRWKSLIPEYNEMLDKIGKPQHKVNVYLEKLRFLKNKITELFSFVYFQASLKHKNTEYFSTNENNLDTSILYTDGSLYEYEYSKRTINQVDDFAKNFNYGSIRNFSNLDKDKCDILDNFLGYMVKKDIEVVIFISPFHPITYSEIISNSQSCIDAESYYRYLSTKHNFNIYGDMNPKILELTNLDFYDGMHLTREGVETIIYN